MKSLPFSPPYYTEAEAKAVQECILRRWTGTGPKTKEFEEKFAGYLGIRNSAGLSSCTAALFLSLKALGVGPGDEVITTAMTFCSTVNIILHCGAKPVLCDIDQISKNIDVTQIEKKITSKTKAIIPVHYAGCPCEMDEIVELCEKYSIYLVEDCAHAIESEYKGQHCGTFGEIGCFSFYATKNIAIGEGGMAVSNKDSLIRKISLLGLHGLSRDAWKRFEQSSRKQYDVVEIGYKMNLTDLQSSIGLCQLEKLTEMEERRRQIWNYYDSELESVHGISLPSIGKDYMKHARHLYACGLPIGVDRDEVVWRAAQEHGITLGVHYQSIPSFSAYRNLWSKEEAIKEYPNAYEWGKRTVSLTLSASVSDEDACRTVDALKGILK